MRFRIRPACTPDIPAMHRVRNSVRENRLSGPARITEASYRPYVAAGSAWVAAAGKDVLGFALLDGPAERVEALFVHPGAEGIGIGFALHRQMLAWAKDQGIRCLHLSTEIGTRAERFYARRGWVRAGSAPNGEVYMELVLRS
jgi:GNAT superfamily N-acetyltransferase